MKKITLDLDSLQVESFVTSGGRSTSGTVAAHESARTDDAACWAGTYGGYSCDTTCQQIECTSKTDDHSLNGTCQNTCHTCVNTCATCAADFCGQTVDCYTVPGYNGC
jgi:hypothetical protein